MRRTGPLYPPLVGLRLLTVFPALRGVLLQPEDLPRAAPWLPVIGAVTGGLIAAITAVLLSTGVSVFLACLVVVILVPTVGGLRDERAWLVCLERLRDRESETVLQGIGLHGAIALIGLFGIRAGALVATDSKLWVGSIVVAQLASRWAVLVLLRLGETVPDPLEPHSVVVAPVSWAGFGAASAGCLLASVLLGGTTGFVALLFGAIVVFAAGLALQGRLGGFSTPALRSGGVLCELVVLVVFAVANPAAF